MELWDLSKNSNFDFQYLKCFSQRHVTGTCKGGFKSESTG